MVTNLSLTGTTTLSTDMEPVNSPTAHTNPIIGIYSNTDVHTVASLLKLYLRELPEPVVPFCKYEDFLTCAQILAKDEEEVGDCMISEHTASLDVKNDTLLTVQTPNLSKCITLRYKSTPEWLQ